MSSHPGQELARDDADVDLGELPRPASTTPPTARTKLAPPRWRPRRPSRRAVRGLVAAVVLALLTGYAGWQAGSGHSRRAAQDTAGQTPTAFAWLENPRADLASSPAEPMADLDLHLLNTGWDTLTVETVSARSDDGTIAAQLAGDPGSFGLANASGQAPEALSGQSIVVPITVRTDCAESDVRASLSVHVQRRGADGVNHPLTLIAGFYPNLGTTLSDTVSTLCAHPTQDSDDGVDGVVIDQTSGTRFATVTATNHSSGPRSVQVTGDGNPAFRLVVDHPDPVVLRPGQSTAFRITVQITRCSTTVGIQDWASALTLQVVRRDSAGKTTGPDPLGEAFPMPDLLLVPGGAALGKACG